MKLLIQIPTLLILPFAFVGCDKHDDTPGDEAARELGEATEDVGESLQKGANEAQKGFDAAWRDVSNYSLERRDELISNLNDSERSLDRELVDLRTRANNLTGETRRRFDAALERLDDARENLRREIAEARQATNENWVTARAEINEAWTDVRDAFREASNTLNRT